MDGSFSTNSAQQLEAADNDAPNSDQLSSAASSSSSSLPTPIAAACSDTDCSPAAPIAPRSKLPSPLPPSRTHDRSSSSTFTTLPLPPYDHTDSTASQSLSSKLHSSTHTDTHSHSLFDDSSMAVLTQHQPQSHPFMPQMSSFGSDSLPPVASRRMSPTPFMKLPHHENPENSMLGDTPMRHVSEPPSSAFSVQMDSFDDISRSHSPAQVPQPSVANHNHPLEGTHSHTPMTDIDQPSMSRSSSSHTTTRLSGMDNPSPEPSGSSHPPLGNSADNSRGAAMLSDPNSSLSHPHHLSPNHEHHGTHSPAPSANPSPVNNSHDASTTRGEGGSATTSGDSSPPVKTSPAIRPGQQVFSKCTGVNCRFLLGHVLTSGLIQCPQCGILVDLLASSKNVYGAPEDFPSHPVEVPTGVLAMWHEQRLQLQLAQMPYLGGGSEPHNAAAPLIAGVPSPSPLDFALSSGPLTGNNSASAAAAAAGLSSDGANHSAVPSGASDSLASTADVGANLRSPMGPHEHMRPDGCFDGLVDPNVFPGGIMPPAMTASGLYDLGSLTCGKGGKMRISPATGCPFQPFRGRRKGDRDTFRFQDGIKEFFEHFYKTQFKTPSKAQCVQLCEMIQQPPWSPNPQFTPHRVRTWFKNRRYQDAVRNKKVSKGRSSLASLTPHDHDHEVSSPSGSSSTHSGMHPPAPPDHELSGEILQSTSSTCEAA